MKASFAVGFRLNHENVCVLGVTSIVPNLNGVLFFTEDGQNYLVESHHMKDGILPCMYIDYEQDECSYDGCYVIDHREKKEAIDVWPDDTEDF